MELVVIESGPLVGVAPTITYYTDPVAARDWVTSRAGFFARIDVARVIRRTQTVVTPLTSDAEIA